MQAAGAMALSSRFDLGNAMRLRRFRVPAAGDHAPVGSDELALAE
jgi:hypothetical protein